MRSRRVLVSSSGAMLREEVGTMNRLRCLLGLHAWNKNHEEQGQVYLRCRNCGKEEDPGSRIRVIGG